MAAYLDAANRTTFEVRLAGCQPLDERAPGEHRGLALLLVLLALVDALQAALRAADVVQNALDHASVNLKLLTHERCHGAAKIVQAPRLRRDAQCFGHELVEPDLRLGET